MTKSIITKPQLRVDNYISNQSVKRWKEFSVVFWIFVVSWNFKIYECNPRTLQAYSCGPAYAGVALGTVSLYSMFTLLVTQWRTQFRVNMNKVLPLVNHRTRYYICLVIFNEMLFTHRLIMKQAIKLLTVLSIMKQLRWGDSVQSV